MGEHLNALGFEWLGALCSPGTAGGGLLVGLFLAGMAGSLLHCGPMCGAFVLGQVADRMARLPAARMCERHRIGGGLLLPYHLGRLLTYAGLGAAAAGSVAVLGQSPGFGRLSAVLLGLAALLFLAHALRRAWPAGFARLAALERAPRAWTGGIGRLTARLPRGTAAGELLLGLALGFLPCGFLYGALIAAAATASPFLGAIAMLCFGLGTAPALMAVGIAGHAAGQRWQRGFAAAAPVLMTVNAVLLLALAWQRLA